MVHADGVRERLAAVLFSGINYGSSAAMTTAAATASSGVGRFADGWSIMKITTELAQRLRSVSRSICYDVSGEREDMQPCLL